eukprot:scaffold1489_cov194-Cylindrotheca_fusiformis.AAC.20
MELNTNDSCYKALGEDTKLYVSLDNVVSSFGNCWAESHNVFNKPFTARTGFELPTSRIVLALRDPSSFLASGSSVFKRQD